jgi:predicted secreted protein
MATVSALLVCAGTTCAQPPDTLWARTFGGTNIDVAYDARQATDGGFIATGYTRSQGSGGHDVWLLKTDPDGHEEWDRAFGGGDDDEGQAVCQTGDGGYVAAGFTESSGAGGKDVWLVKADASGDELWTRVFGGAHDEEAYAVQETVDGGLIVAGATSSYGAGGRDVWLIKTDDSGMPIWTRTLGGFGSDGAWSVSLTADSGFVLAGWTFSSGPGFLGNAWLVKTDSLGTIEWDRTFGGADADRGYAVRQTTDGGYVMAGYTGSSGAGLYDLYLVKTDDQGTLEWSQAFGGSGRDYGRGVVQTADGGYLAAGYTLSYGAGGDDVWLVRTAADGTFRWQTTYGGSASDVGYSLAHTTDGGFLVAGHTLSFGAGLHDAWLIRLAPEGTSAIAGRTVAPPVMALGVQPNPFSRSATIGFAVPGASRATLRIHDASGRMVRLFEQPCCEAGMRSVVWDGLGQGGERVAPGVYFCRLESGGVQTVVKIVRVE